MPIVGGLELTAKEWRDYRRGQILDILSEQGSAVGSQEDLVMLLKLRGIQATQSSVSRDLRDLGVVRVNGRYQVTDWSYKSDQHFQRIVTLIETVCSSGPNILVVQTLAGSAKAVGAAIEMAKWPEVKGVLAGETTIFIATSNQQDQARVMQRFKTFLIPDD